MNKWVYTAREGSHLLRQLPSLVKSILATVCSPVCTPHSTIDARGLNFQVRHGSGCISAAFATNNFVP